jgi:hypothetical protein
MYVCSLSTFIDVFAFGVGAGMLGTMGALFVMAHLYGWFKRKKK